MGTRFTQHNKINIFTARKGSRILQNLTAIERGDVINRLADLLISKEDWILQANRKDLQTAEETGLAKPLLSRLSLTPSKLQTLSNGLKQIAEDSLSIVGRVVRRTKVAEGMNLKQVTVPLGVLMVIFESRPDCLPQVIIIIMEIIEL